MSRDFSEIADTVATLERLFRDAALSGLWQRSTGHLLFSNPLNAGGAGTLLRIPREEVERLG